MLTNDELVYLFTNEEDLKSSPIFNLNLDSSDPVVVDLTNYLLNQFTNGQQLANQPKYFVHLKLLVINILSCLKVSDDTWLSINKSTAYYNDLPSKYNPFGIKRYILVKLFDWLEKSSFIIVKQGYRAAHKSRWTRTLAADNLKQIIQRYKALNAVISAHKNKETIQLKDTDKKLTTYANTKSVKSMRNKLDKFNGLIDRADIQLNGSRLRPYLYRVFNDSSFKLGGRFYCPMIQNLSSDVNTATFKSRRYLTINGDKVTELDFKSLHPNLLYAEKSVPLTVDPYAISNYPRDFIKDIFLIILNTRDRKHAIETCFHHYKGQHGCKTKSDFASLIEAIETHNKTIKNKFYGQVAKRLQFTDSRLTENILMEFTSKDIPIIPIHDSYIVQVKHGQLLEQTMKDTYKDLIGQSIGIDKKY